MQFGAPHSLWVQHHCLKYKSLVCNSLSDVMHYVITKYKICWKCVSWGKLVGFAVILLILHSEETSDKGGEVPETETPFTLLQDSAPSTWQALILLSRFQIWIVWKCRPIAKKISFSWKSRSKENTQECSLRLGKSPPHSSTELWAKLEFWCRLKHQTLFKMFYSGALAVLYTLQLWMRLSCCSTDSLNAFKRRLVSYYLQFVGLYSISELPDISELVM